MTEKLIDINPCTHPAFKLSKCEIRTDILKCINCSETVRESCKHTHLGVESRSWSGSDGRSTLMTRVGPPC